MPSDALRCLFVGGLTTLMTAAICAMSYRAIRIAAAAGPEGASLRRMAMMWACMGLLVVSGFGVALLMIVIAVPFASGSPMSPDATRASLAAFAWLYCVWLPAATFAIPVTGRWGRRAFRTFPILRRGEARCRLVWFRFRRSRPIRSIRSVARRYDRELW